MANNENLKPFKKGNDARRNIGGRPQGSKNRSTIIRELLDHNDNELAIHKAQLDKALKGDTNSYKAILDNAYGKPTPSIETENGGQLSEKVCIMFVPTKKDE